MRLPLPQIGEEKMSKHTKGPWVANGTNVFGPNSNSNRICRAQKELAFQVRISSSEAEANAKLIAASPELLNLAKQIAPMIKSGQLDTLCDLAEIVIEQAESGTKK